MFKKVAICISFSIFLFGIYDIILLGNLFFPEAYTWTKQLRVLMVVGFLSLALSHPRQIKVPKKIVLLFSFFCLIYISRIAVDYIQNDYYYLDKHLVFSHFMVFCIIPFFSIINTNFNENDLSLISKIFNLFAFLFPIAIYLNFGEYFGNVTRLDAGVVDDEDSILSPLILSYNSSIIIGVLSFNLLFNKNSLIRILIYTGIIIITLIPFSLGASRGSVFTLIVPLIILFLLQFNRKDYLKYIFYTIILFSLSLNYGNTIVSGIIERFNRSSFFGGGANKDHRAIIWEDSLNQFYNNPIFGDKLAVDNWDLYPHNLFIETLQATGILGFLPLFILLFFSFKYSIDIIKNNPKFGWISILFYQAFLQTMFSFSIYGSHFLWPSVALVLVTTSITKYRPSFRI